MLRIQPSNYVTPCLQSLVGSLHCWDTVTLSLDLPNLQSWDFDNSIEIRNSGHAKHHGGALQ